MFMTFLVDYDSVDVADILDFHEYLMKKHGVKKCLNLWKKFIVLLSVCTIVIFSGSLTPNSEKSIKWFFKKISHAKPD